MRVQHFLWFLKSRKRKKSVCVKDIQLFTDKDQQEALGKVAPYTEKLHDLQLIVSGENGDRRTEVFYGGIRNHFSHTPIISYKQICGEYATASAFGLGMLVHMLQAGKTPDHILAETHLPATGDILMINNYMHYCSIWHLTIA